MKWVQGVTIANNLDIWVINLLIFALDGWIAIPKIDVTT